MIDQQQFATLFLGLLSDVVGEMQRLSAVEGPPGPPGPVGPPGPAGAGLPAVFVQKTSSEQVVSSTVLQDDDALFFAVAANEKWVFLFYVVYEGGTTPDLKIAISGPAASTVLWSAHPQWSAGNGFQVPDSLTEASVLPLGAAGTGSRSAALLVGLIVNGANAGACKLQWAQNTSGTAATVVHPSWVLAFKVNP